MEGVSIGDKLEASKYDLFFIGGGQDFEQGVLLQDLSGEKTAEIKAAIEDEKVFLAICGGYQILGSYYKTWDGQQCDFLGALDLYTVGQKDRMIGNYMYECDDLGGQTVVGFENHSGQTFLGAVSYTHLDVYKRQAQRHSWLYRQAAPQSCGGISGNAGGAAIRGFAASCD